MSGSTTTVIGYRGMRSAAASTRSSSVTSTSIGGSPGNGAAIWFASTLAKIVAPAGSAAISGRTTSANVAASAKNSVSSINRR